jgi:hypothetical protein
VHDLAAGKPVPVLRLSPTAMRKLMHLRDVILHGVGTTEPFVSDDMREMEAETGRPIVAMHWRKPLSIMEVNQMAPTPEVRARAGRP